MSTLWLSERVQHVRSLEWDKHWSEMLQAELTSQSKTNVELRFVSGLADDAVADIPDGSIDLAFVDAGSRPVFFKLLWPKLKPGGHVYLDDWDSDKWWVDNYNARHLVEDLSDKIATKTLFIDYSPTQLAVTEGLLLEKRR